MCCEADECLLEHAADQQYLAAWGKILSSMLQAMDFQQVYDSHLLVSGNNSREMAFEIPLTMKSLFGKSTGHLEIE